jgi:hypothetical protein
MNIEAVRMFVKSKIGQIQAVSVLVEAVRVKNIETVRLFVKSMRGQIKSFESVEDVGFFADAIRECLYRLQECF